MNIKGLHGNGYACCLYTSHVNLNNISIDVYYESSLRSSLRSDSSINFPSPCDTPIYLALITCRLFLTGICSAWRASLPSFSSWDLCLCQRARGGWLSMRGRNTLAACFRPWGGTSTLTKNSIASKIATLKHEMVNVRKILVVINKWIYIYNILHAIKNIWSNVIYIIKYRVMLLYYDFFQNS